MLTITVDVRPADVNQRPIRPQRRHGDDLLGLADRIDEFNQILVELGDAGADAAAPRKEFLAGGRGKQAGIKDVLAALPDLDLPGLDVLSQIVPDRAVHLLAHIGRDELLYAAGAYQKIDLEARCGRRDDREILRAIPD